MQTRSNGHGGATGGKGHSAAAHGKPGMRAKWRHSRSILKEGLEAALRASPEVLEKCKPKTNYGNLVRGLVLEAAKCKATPLKTLMSLIDWEPAEDEEDGEEILEEGRRDWSPEGVWETMPEAVPASEPADEQEELAKQEVKRRLMRMLEAGQHEHVARIVDVIRSGKYSEPEPISTA
ncbi:MAG TPA: hypothetical protein VKR31_09315 [Rhizomicrobium sp.]|nr:hypothetical protein [Rhizomicrobium sp.]